MNLIFRRPLSTLTKPRTIFSGIQPTGIPHLGNYLGALSNWVDLQKNANPQDQLLFSVVGWHALTLPQDPKELATSRRDMLAVLLAIGLDPKRSIIFHQDSNAMHTELAWILGCITPTGKLRRMTSWKTRLAQSRNANDESEVDESLLNAGLLTYPVLQAADILLYRATHVPVGDDQRQHLELSRDIADTFNRTFKDSSSGRLFPVPTSLITPAKRILSLKDPSSKMSKSTPDPASRILLTDSPSLVASKIRAAVTDSITTGITYDPVSRPGTSNLLSILAACEEGEVDPEAVALRCAADGMSHADLKKEVSERVNALLEKPRAEFSKIRADEGYLEQISREGAEKAKVISSETMESVGNHVIGLCWQTVNILNLKKTETELRQLLEVDVEDLQRLKIRINNNEFLGGLACDVALLKGFKSEYLERLRAIRIALGMDCTASDDSNWEEEGLGQNIPEEELWSPPLTPSLEDEVTRDILQDQYGRLLKDTFKIDMLRVDQAVAIEHTMAKRDVFVFKPTGSGKSLVYQLPAMAERKLHPRKVTVVVSPLQALIHDQEMSCIAHGIPVLAITSDRPQSDETIRHRFWTEEPVLIYVTPERLNRSTNFHRFLCELYRNDHISRFALDEIHSLLSWGLTFRPEYLNLTFLREDFPHVPIVALTATTTTRSIQEITTLLRMTNTILVRSSLIQGNLQVTIHHKSGNSSQVGALVKDIQSKPSTHSGIVYYNSRSGCAYLAKKLEAEGIRVALFHAGLSPDEKRASYANWMNGSIQVMVATNAFGMGVDKPDVRFIVHYDCPKSTESYLQEIGRAGRDGQDAECILYYRYSDLFPSLFPSRLDNMTPKARRRMKQAKELVEVLHSSSCINQRLYRYFGERSAPCNKQCSNCLNGASRKTVDFALFSKVILGYLRDIFTHKSNEKVTPNQLVELLCGRKAKNERNSHPGYGSAKDHNMTFELVEKVLGALIHRQALTVERASSEDDHRNKHWYIKFGAKALDHKYLDADGCFHISFFESPSMRITTPSPARRAVKTKRHGHKAPRPMAGHDYEADNSDSESEWEGGSGNISADTLSSDEEINPIQISSSKRQTTRRHSVISLSSDSDSEASETDSSMQSFTPLLDKEQDLDVQPAATKAKPPPATYIFVDSGSDAEEGLVAYGSDVELIANLKTPKKNRTSLARDFGTRPKAQASGKSLSPLYGRKAHPGTRRRNNLKRRRDSSVEM
ncbi:hypothetical protein MIND_00011700 [Mycena indigotica]|uniref:tryptophan--tRNA ligase n=1 Tax=Mycena indigotica TaxID=2126181 RepID=A0A8H6TCL6_9AGAR|nr:uncharacterized protein MIND_00011700 [Mycena indigotica]KAF7314976.1 hypothetical protein MIND_00011700 [Mycena indigotica]